MIRNPMAQFSDTAAVSNIAKAAKHNQPPTKASCELQDLRLGVGEVTGGLTETSGFNIAWSPLSPFASSLQRGSESCLNSKQEAEQL